MTDFERPMTQAEFGSWVGIGQPAVSDLVRREVLRPGETGKVWLLAYCDQLRGQAAGRMSADGTGLDLVQERAALAREMRIKYEMANAVQRGEYAPISLLTEVLATASQAVVDRLDLLPSQLRKAVPKLPDLARQQIDTTIASARNAWVSEVVKIVGVQLGATDEDMAAVQDDQQDDDADDDEDPV